MIRRLAGSFGEIAANAELLATVTTLVTPTGMMCPRRLEVFDWHRRSQGSCELGVGGGPVRIDGRGTIWLADAAALLGFDERARQVHLVEPPLPEGAQIDAFLPLDDGFVVTCGGITAATVMRLRTDGSPVWTRVMPSGPVTLTLDGQTIGPYAPKEWYPTGTSPLVVAGGSLLAALGESWGQAYLCSSLDLAEGTVRWTTPEDAYTDVAALAPDGFLLGKRSWGRAATLAILGGSIQMSWPIEGRMLVTESSLWMVADGRQDVTGSRPAVAVVPRDGRPASLRSLSPRIRGTPCALAGETILVLCGEGWTRLDASGAIVENHDLGALASGVSRVVTNNRGRFAFIMHGFLDREPSQLWILDTDLPPLASGPWPCDGGDPEHRARCDDPGAVLRANMSTLPSPVDAARGGRRGAGLRRRR